MAARIDRCTEDLTLVWPEMSVEGVNLSEGCVHVWGVFVVCTYFLNMTRRRKMCPLDGVFDEMRIAAMEDRSDCLGMDRRVSVPVILNSIRALQTGFNSLPPPPEHFSSPPAEPSVPYLQV